MATNLPKLLKKLQHEVRSEGPLDTPYGRRGVVPDHVAAEEGQWLHVGPGIVRLIRQVTDALLADEHYEHLADGADAAVWEFVCKSAIQRGADHVKAFIGDHCHELQSFTVEFSVDDLKVAGPEPVGDAVLLPLPDKSTRRGQHLRRDAAAGCMAQVVVTGTRVDRAIERARERARHALSLLRVSLADMKMLHGQQLRFRVGQMYLIEELEGFQRHPDAAFGIDFDAPIRQSFPAFKQLEIPFTGGTEIENRLVLAVSWIDAAYMDASAIHRVGFLFTALEAMLGDSAEGLKAPALVFYRTALGHVVRGHFPDPNRLYYLYDRVRSYATHGEATPDVSEDDISYLTWNIQETLLDLVTLCREHHLTSRKQVRQALLRDGVDEITLTYLRSRGPQEWWSKWSPGPKSSKEPGGQDLAAKVAALETELDVLRSQLALLQARPIDEAEQTAEPMDDVTPTWDD